jgi:cell fate regulator YaaT (PSP1 superfamily)
MDSALNIVGIRFQKIGRLYHFDATHIQDLKPGEFVLVDTMRGIQLGQVITRVMDPQRPAEGWKPIYRRANAQDMLLRQHWQQKELEATINCRAIAAELKIQDVKFVASEFSFDGTRLAIMYSNEAGERMEFRNLRRAMLRTYPNLQIEFHLIGPRDVAKILGGMGACGLETRCCSAFLTDFSPVSIKMAKEQGISLTPTEITGMCGRLRCCLVYEYEQYVEARKQLPKRNKRVITPMGEGKVVDVLPLKQSVLVEMPNGIIEFLHHEIQPADELEALQQKSQKGCDRHPNGNCECGRKTSSENSSGG